MRHDKPLVLIAVQNLPLPGDRRVWLECQALRDAGFRVAAITPKNPGDPVHAVLDGIDLYRYRAPRPVFGVLGFLYEFVYCWLRTAALAARVVRRHGRPAVFQACNPPDTYWLLARVLKPLGVRFVFDQHDLCPELFESRFGRRGALYAVVRWLERQTYNAADHVIATNQSYRITALKRGKLRPQDVSVVRTGPDAKLLSAAASLVRSAPDNDQRLVHFHGVMGPQDSVDVVVETARIFAKTGRTDVRFHIMGAGDTWPEMKARVEALGLTNVYMPGRVSDAELFDSLARADVGLSPDLPNPLNDVSTMNKVLEYMAFGVPVLSFDLAEARVSAQDAAEYVQQPSAEAYATALLALLDDEVRLKDMGRVGAARVREKLSWEGQKDTYLDVVRQLTARNN